LILLLRSWGTLVAIHQCIAIVNLLCLIEAFVSWLLLNDWNNSGTKSRLLTLFSVVASLTKSISSYMLVLVTSLGWGVTRPYLDKDTVRKLQALSVCFIVFGFVKGFILSDRHLPLKLDVLCMLPLASLNAFIVYWTLAALSNLIRMLKERQQTIKLQRFQRLFRLLAFFGLSMIVNLMIQVHTISKSFAQRWKHEWVLHHCIPHLLYAFVLMVMMYLWRPQSNSHAFAYSSTDDGDKREGNNDDDDDELRPKNEGAGVWVDEEEEHDDAKEDTSFWANTHSHPKVRGEA